MHTVCHRGFLTFQQTRKADNFVVIGALRVTHVMLNTSMITPSHFNNAKPLFMETPHKKGTFKKTVKIWMKCHRISSEF